MMHDIRFLDLAGVRTAVDWARLEAMRVHKLSAPASGTTCIRGPDGRALWFSKAVLPFMRKEADLRCRATFDSAPIGIMHTAIDSYRILHVNPKLCAMLGYSEAELLQMTSTDVVHPESQELVLTAGSLLSEDVVERIEDSPTKGRR